MRRFRHQLGDFLYMAGWLILFVAAVVLLWKDGNTFAGRAWDCCSETWHRFCCAIGGPRDW